MTDKTERNIGLTIIAVSVFLYTLAVLSCTLEKDIVFAIIGFTGSSTASFLLFIFIVVRIVTNRTQQKKEKWSDLKQKQKEARERQNEKIALERCRKLQNMMRGK